MSTQLEKIEQEALNLPIDEQVELIERLVSHVNESPTEMSPAWLEEIEKRVAKAKSEGIVGRSMEEISLEISGNLDSSTRINSNETNAISKEELRRMKRARFAEQCAKLDPAEEQELAEEGYGKLISKY